MSFSIYMSPGGRTDKLGVETDANQLIPLVLISHVDDKDLNQRVFVPVSYFVPIILSVLTLLILVGTSYTKQSFSPLPR